MIVRLFWHDHLSNEWEKMQKNKIRGMKKKLFLINFSEEQICFIFKIKGMQKNAKKKLFLINGKNN